ncbi:MAG: CopD family protein [Gammaproteobacteria bacterium]|nr:CopD family protein [Gammaproteobacteria bacterium]
MTLLAACLARWLALVCGLALPGLGLWVLLVGTTARSARLLQALALGGALGALVLLVAQSAEASGQILDWLRPEAWLTYAASTRAGQLAALRILAFALAALLASRVASGGKERTRLVLISGVTLGGLIAYALSGHAAASGDALSLCLQILHLLTASLWFGGLLALQSLSREADLAGRQRALGFLARFSRCALPLMSLTLACGLGLAWRELAPRYAALVATPWGGWLLLKLGLVAGILLLAARIRWRWLPRLQTTLDPALWSLLLRDLRRDFGLALLLLGAAAALGRAVPGLHAPIVHWPWPWRFSLAATLPEAATLSLLVAGGTLLLTSALLALRPALRRLGGTAGLAGAGLALYALAVPASVDTYRDAEVPFDAISIANGAQAFATHCTGCHGLQGKGDGPLASSLPKPPVDLLTEPHTARHTPGDFFHWISHGIPGTGMPGFAQTLDEDARWDVINFLHALNRGFDARILRPASMPFQPQPRLGAPDFDYATREGAQGSLRAAYGKHPVLLVLSRGKAAEARLQALAGTDWQDLGLQILAVPLEASAPTTPLTVADNAAAIATTYALVRRSLGNPDWFGGGRAPDHMELLIDRFGYLRARWLPAEDGAGWADLKALRAEVARLNAEPALLPPPSEHVH